VLNSFFWNKAWTFRSQANAREVFLPFVVVTLLAVGLNTGMMYTASALWQWPELVSLALATAVAFVWNFTTNKYVVFKSNTSLISR
jgi:putative flippase GtrA